MLPTRGTDFHCFLQPIEVRHTLLYIEDHPANLILVEQLIARHAHWKLLTATDGKLGIAKARSSRPELIAMDINLPDISGFDALSILRADPLTTNIPVIAVSSNAFPRDIEKGLDAGFFRYLTKPYKINDFMAVLDDFLKFANESHDLN